MKGFRFKFFDVRFLLIALVGVALSSCQMFEKPEYQLSSLQALWHETQVETDHFVRFTTEKSDETGYLYGREWDLADEVTEEDLFKSLEDLGVHGNGWFKYKFETNGNLTEIHLMDNGGADIPKIYIVSKLTETELEFYEKDFKNIKFYFTKVAETK